MRILDIASSLGRDAAYFAKQGHEVTAVKPVREMRLTAEKLHGKQRIRWIDDQLPELSELACQNLRYDVVWLSAVLMHLDQAQRLQSLRKIDESVRPEGHIFITLRHGPVPLGRCMFEASSLAFLQQIQLFIEVWYRNCSAF